jgi:hypothetical protein
LPSAAAPAPVLDRDLKLAARAVGRRLVFGETIFLRRGPFSALPAGKTRRLIYSNWTLRNPTCEISNPRAQRGPGMLSQGPARAVLRAIVVSAVIMKSQHSNLVGLFLVLDSPDHEHYRTGQIVAAASYTRKLVTA